MEFEHLKQRDTNFKKFFEKNVLRRSSLIFTKLRETRKFVGQI